MQVGVHMPADPALAAWKGGSDLGASPGYGQAAISRAAYEECGADYLLGLA